MSDSLAIRSSADVASLDQLDEILRGGDFNVEVVDDPAEVSKQIVNELLNAKTDDELEYVGTAEGWGEYEGIPIEIRSFRWRPSDFDNSAIYAVVFGTRLDTGDPVTLTTGSLNVMAALSNMARRGLFPGAIRILKRAEKPTKANFYPHFLVRTDAEKQSVADSVRLEQDES